MLKKAADELKQQQKQAADVAENKRKEAEAKRNAAEELVRQQLEAQQAAEVRL